MTLLRSLPLVLLLLTACRPPEDIDAPPPSDAEFGEDDGSRFKADKDKMRKARDKGEEGDESRLSRNGLGKEDFALVEAELACVREHYAADEKLLPLAEAAVYQRYGASEQWVERVRVHAARAAERTLDRGFQAEEPCAATRADLPTQSKAKQRFPQRQ